MDPMTKPTAQPSLDQMRVDVCLWMYPETDPAFRRVINIHDLPAFTLDWLHEREKKLSLDQRTTYLDYLRDITQQNRMATILWTCTNATATQRLLALWRTIKGL
jgi:hypothetical protein